MGVYPVAYTLNITDQQVKTINAKANFSKTGIDTECFVNIVFEDNSKATLVSSFEKDRNSPGVIEFENGTIIAENFWRSQKASIDNVVYEFPFIGEGFPYQINSFVDTINEKLFENEIMTHDQTRKSMILLDRIRKSIGLIYPFE